VFVSADDGDVTRLWRLEGESLVPIAGSEGTILLVRGEFADGRLLLYGPTTSLEYEPWIVEGDIARKLDLSPGPPSTRIYSFDAVGGLVYFARGPGGVQPRDLWATDGDDAWLVLDALPEGPGVQSLVVHEDRLLLLASTTGRGHELWIADAAGQVLPLQEAYPGPAGILSWDGSFGATALGQAVYVLDTSQGRGDLLWEVRGDSVTRAAQIAPPYPPTGVAQFGAIMRGVVAGELILDQYDDRSGSRLGFLWAGDGTTFRRIHDFELLDDPMSWLVPVDDRAYFMVVVPQFGAEVFEIAGDTVQMVLPEIRPGASPPHGAGGGHAIHGGRLYLSGDDGVHGRELWVVTPGPVAANPLPDTPASLSITAIYPNPATLATTLDLMLGTGESVTVEVFDVLGRRVRSEVRGPLGAGAQALQLDLAGVAPGPYVIRLRVADGVAAARLVVAPR
jgi:hypothetical protein